MPRAALRRRENTAGNSRPAVPGRIGAIVVRAGMDNDRRAVFVEKGVTAPGDPGGGDRIFQRASAIGADKDVGHVALVHAGGILAAVPAVGRVPMPAGTVEARRDALPGHMDMGARSEEHTSELQSLMRNSYAVFCFKKK